MSTCEAQREGGGKKRGKKEKRSRVGRCKQVVSHEHRSRTNNDSFRLLLFSGRTIELLFFTWWSKSQGYFCETKLFLEKGWPTRGHGQMARPGELTARFFFLFFLFSIIFYVHASSFKHLKFCFQSDTYGFC